LNYEEFISEVARKSEAIAIIYHMIILNEIGVDTAIINDWIYTQSFTAKAHLVEAGLLDESVLRPATPGTSAPG
jgi:hypothetical protein